MRTILALAVKDLRLLFRVRSGLFFAFVWPVVVAVLFGVVFSGQGQTSDRTLRVVVVDDNYTDGARDWLAKIEASDDFSIDYASRPEAETLVRRGQRAAFIALNAGIGQIEIGHDPARQPEAWMIEGLLTKHAMSDYTEMLASVGGRLMQITRTPVAQQRIGPSNGFEITFPQGVMWGIIGCVMSFAIGLVSERVRGTFVRLQMAPLTRAQILAGKALACFASISGLQVILFAVGVAVFDVRIDSVPLLVMACAAASIGFVGFMMMVAGLGRTEQAASGAGWAMLMPMTLFGGGMMPQFIMPPWMRTVGNLSPVKWAILGMEGAVWRGFSLGEMLGPAAILLGFGVVCFTIGVRALRD